MDRLINELTFYSKIDTNRIPYTFNQDLMWQNILMTVWKRSAWICVDRDIEFAYFNYGGSRMTLVIADAEQMKRVINNIIGNSVKYMDKKEGRDQYACQGCRVILSR